jgi:hypothetical protein
MHMGTVASVGARDGEAVFFVAQKGEPRLDYLPLLGAGSRVTSGHSSISSETTLVALHG